MIYLRALEEKDAPYMLEWMHDPDVSRYFQFDGKSKNMEDAIKYIQSSQVAEEHQHFAITDEKDIYLGTVSLKNIDRKNQTAEYAISLRRCAIGSGAAKIATQAVLRKAFYELKLHKVYLNVFNDNERAIRFYEKMGFIYEGTFHDHVFTDRGRKSLKWYAIYKEGLEKWTEKLN